MTLTRPLAGRPVDTSPPALPGLPGPPATGPGSAAGRFRFPITMAFSAVPAPLYVLYAARDGFGPLMVTVIFAAYAASVLASLFLAADLGLAVPVVALGVAAELLSARTAVSGFAAVLAGGIALVSRRCCAARPRPCTPELTTGADYGANHPG